MRKSWLTLGISQAYLPGFSSELVITCDITLLSDNTVAEDAGFLLVINGLPEVQSPSPEVCLLPSRAFKLESVYCLVINHLNALTSYTIIQSLILQHVSALLRRH